jgi:Ca2+-binding RTX toxin-like protein
MVNDVMAIQAIYGAETTTRTGDTVYGFNSNITGSAATFYNFDLNGNPILTIYDSAGVDTLDLSGYTTRCNISLVGGTYSDCNEMTYNIGIAYSAVIENAVGGSAADTLTGNAIANMLTGGRGSDTIDGGGGNDIAVFSGDYSNYTVVSNGNGSFTVTDNVGNDGSDTLISIELLRFRDRDVIEGDSNTAPVLAQAIADQRADADIPFSFTIPAGSFTDPNGDALTYAAELRDGTPLPEWLSFNARTGTFSGKPGAGDVGTISVVVFASDGNERATDTFDIVINDTTGGNGEDIFGTFASDTLSGTGESERIFGLLGKDEIFAGDGNDILYGGNGADFLWGEAGADTFGYNFVGDSPWKNKRFDVIMDFNGAEGDIIDLRMIDANALRFGDQSFVFAGNGDGRAARGQIDYMYSKGDTHLFGYTDRDKNPDFYLKLEGIVDLDAGSFAL